MAEVILVSSSPGETRTALLEGGRLVELMVERAGAQGVAGNVYLGRVTRALPGIAAAFVDIGGERSAFLALAEARPPGQAAGRDRITDYASEGDAVVVQVAQDARADKGAKLTTRIALAGRLVVLTPGQPGIRASKRMGGEPERARLNEALGTLARAGEGFILRTGAAQASAADLARDVAGVRAAWAEIEAKRASARPPACLYREPPALLRALRDESLGGTPCVVVDDAAVAREARAFCAGVAPELADLIEIHGGASPLFEAYGVEAAIEAALLPGVALPSGARLVFAETAAVTAIDVDSGGRSEGGPEDTALATNREAAAEIARQLRLRGIAGHVVIDFVAMRRPASRAAVLAALDEALSADRVPSFVAGFTRMGLVELTRERRRPSLAETLLDACWVCEGGGRTKSAETVALEALRAVAAAARAAPGTALALSAPPAVIALLEGALKAARAEVEARVGGLALRREAGMAAGRFEVLTQAKRRPGDGEG